MDFVIPLVDDLEEEDDDDMYANDIEEETAPLGPSNVSK